MRKIFNFRVADVVFKVIQHDMTEKKAGVTVAYPVTYKDRPLNASLMHSSVGKTVCHKDDKFNELIGIKQACFKSFQKMFSIGISESQAKIDHLKNQYQHCVHALELKITCLYSAKTKKIMEEQQ